MVMREKQPILQSLKCKPNLQYVQIKSVRKIIDPLHSLQINTHCGNVLILDHSLIDIHKLKVDDYIVLDDGNDSMHYLNKNDFEYCFLVDKTTAA